MQAFADGGVGHKEHVILVLAHRIGTLRRETADDAKGNVFDADGLIDGIAGLKELGHERVADDANLGGGGDVAFTEEAAAARVQLPTVG